MTNSHEGIDQLLEEEIFLNIRDVIVKSFGVQESRVNNDLRFDDLGADTLDVVEVAMQVEDTFNIRFQSKKAASFETVGDIVAEIIQLLNHK